MKICYIGYNLDPKSGWGRYGNDIITGAREAGHEVVTVIINNRGPGFVWGLLRSLLVARRCDIIYGLDGWPYGVVAWITSRIWKAKLIVGAIGTYTIAPFSRPATSYLVSRAYRNADSVIAISRYTRDRLLEKVPKARVTVITPGVHFSRWQVDHRVTNQSPYIMSVGALKRRKGYHTILEAFALTRQQIPVLEWVIVGSQDDAGYVSDLRSRAGELGVQDNIRMYERISDKDLKELYAKASVFILLSENHNNHFEGFGIVFLEAACAGLPVIGTKGNGIEDAVGPENGILVPQGDDDATATAIIDIFSDTNHWKMMSAASLAWAKKHSVDDMVKRYEEIYRRVL